MTKKNLYLILDLMPGVSHSEIIHAYNRARQTYSKGSLAAYTLIDEESSQEILEEIEEAYKILGNPVKRREYDLKMGFPTWKEEGIVSRNQDEDLLQGPVIFSKNPPGSVENFESESSQEARVDLSIEEKKPALATLHTLKTELKSDLSKSAQERSLSESSTFIPNPDFEKTIAECQEIDGAFLKALRIYRGLSPDQLAARCKLSASHVVAIEEEDSQRLHHPVYVRGHVVMIGKILGLPEADALAKKFVERLVKEKKISPNRF